MYPIAVGKGLVIVGCTTFNIQYTTFIHYKGEKDLTSWLVQMHPIPVCGTPYSPLYIRVVDNHLYSFVETWEREGEENHMLKTMRACTNAHYKEQNMSLPEH